MPPRDKILLIDKSWYRAFITRGFPKKAFLHNIIPYISNDITKYLKISLHLSQNYYHKNLPKPIYSRHPLPYTTDKRMVKIHSVLLIQFDHNLMLID